MGGAAVPSGWAGKLHLKSARKAGFSTVGVPSYLKKKIIRIKKNTKVKLIVKNKFML